jgi:hypothetical protein
MKHKLAKGKTGNETNFIKTMKENKNQSQKVKQEP